MKNKRLKFSKGAQRLFIDKCALKLDYTRGDLARCLDASIRTISDWRREKFLMPLSAARILSRKTKIPFPRGTEVRDQFWYVTKGGKKGGYATYQKYGRIGGDENYRLKRRREWWEKEGKWKDYKIFHPFPFTKPKRSLELAEFIGIMMGDGGMSKHQVAITLHHIDDFAYSKFVARLIRKLFKVSPSVYHLAKDSVNNIVVSRSGMVRYLHKLGLPIGSKVKQQFDIPAWIKKEKRYCIACIRGLFDTDGSVIRHRYFSGGKYYTYKKVDFTSRSKSLLHSVSSILNRHGIKHRFRDQFQIRIEAQKDVKKYFIIVNSHNPKHLKKYHAAL